MFYYLDGKVTVIDLGLVVIDCNGVGYAVHTTTTTISKLKMGERSRVYTFCNIREDAFDIFGFHTLNEKHFFELLIGVSGVGPKAALSILSSGTPESLAMAIIAGDEKALTVAQGIGKKIAQRVILELKDKIAKDTAGIDFGGGSAVSTGGTAVGSSKINDAVAALSVLGYGSAEIRNALSAIDTENSPLESIIKQALKLMLKN